MVNVFEYLDYRKFLCDYYKSRKNLNGYSFGTMAKEIGITSRGLIKLIIDGKRNLNLHTIPKLCRAFLFNKSETHYFETLVKFNHTNDAQEKNDLFFKLQSFPQKRKISQLERERYSFYSQWYYSAIYEAMTLENLPKERESAVQWLSKRFSSQVTTNEIKNAISHLLSLGVLKENSDGSLTQTNQFISLNGNGKADFAFQNFQRNILNKAIEAIEKPVDQRDLTGVTLAMKKGDYLEAITMIKKFRNEFNLKFNTTHNSDSIYQLNIQLFDLTDGTAENKISCPTDESLSSVNAIPKVEMSATDQHSQLNSNNNGDLHELQKK